MPTFKRAFLPGLTEIEAPGAPMVALIPDLLKLILTPGPILIDFRNRSAMSFPIVIAIWQL
jgi:hypothetical protein